MIVVYRVHYFLFIRDPTQSQREDPDAIYGTVDDDLYATVGDTGQSYYSMVCHCLHACVYMLSFKILCVSACMHVCLFVE